MTEEETNPQDENKAISRFPDNPADSEIEEARLQLQKERDELEAEKKLVLEMKKIVEGGHEKLKKEMEDIEYIKQASRIPSAGKEVSEETDGIVLEKERKKLDSEWNQISAEEKRLDAERRKLDILFDEISSRKVSLDRDITKTKEDQKTLENKEKQLSELETSLQSLKEEYETEKDRWDKERETQLVELRSLPDQKAEIELERTNLRLERMRFEEEKKPLEEERRYLEAKRSLMDEEQEIIEQQRRIIENQKKRLIEGGKLNVEAKYELEKPIPKAREPRGSGTPRVDEERSSVYDIGVERLDRTRYVEKESTKDKTRRERLRSLDSKLHHGEESTRVKKRVSVEDRKDTTTVGKEAGKFPTMTCISCNASIPIPPGTSNIVCPGCNREYKIRGRSKGKSPQKRKSTTTAPAISSKDKVSETDTPTPYTSVLPQGSQRQEANIQERSGKYFIHCLNPSCKSEIELSNSSMKRVHCTKCGRRNKIAPLE